MMKRLNMPYLLSVLLAAVVFYFAWTSEFISNPWLALALIAILQPAIYYALRHARNRYS
jgi:multisubunit Na+/H+ antiporter MnhG subunit